LAAATVADHPLRDRFRDVLNHEASERATLAERAMLRTLEGGCRVPVGAWGRIVNSRDVWLRGLVVSPDGTLVYRGEAVGGEAEEVGGRLARELLGQGAEVVLGEIREVRSR
jgi:hydroxymethylbilane synthase